MRTQISASFFREQEQAVFRGADNNMQKAETLRKSLERFNT